MNQDLISELRLREYARLMESNITPECRLNLFDEDATSWAFSLPPSDEELVISVDTNDSEPAEWSVLSENIEIHMGSNNFLLLRKQIVLGSEQKCHWLTALFPLSKTELKNDELISKANSLEQVCELVCDDFTNSLALDGMAHELAIRYEELNMIYRLEDNSVGGEDNELDESLALMRLIENCLDYLNVDLAAIIIPSDNISLSQFGNEPHAFNSDAILNIFSHNILSQVKMTGETLVVNRDEVSDWLDIDTEVPVKFIVSPVFSSDHTVAGIFVFANQVDKPNFTNSDRKLCDVFAIEVANILKRNRDSITGLLNRRGFEDKVESAIVEVKENNEKYSLIHLDIDQFKIVNDTNGYAAGDKLLQQVASILRSRLDDFAVIARINVDQYTILLKEHSVDRTEQVAIGIQRAMKELQFVASDLKFDINLSVGVLDLKGDLLVDSSTILKASLIACTAAKEMGGNRIRIYDSSDKDLLEQHKLMHGADLVTEALRNDRFVLFAQEIVARESNNGHGSHYEVLIRMLDANDEIVPPGLFIPVAERYKMMVKMDKWVVEHSIDMLSEFNQLTGSNSITLSINISGQSIGDDRFKIFVANKIAKSKVAPAQLCFEVTETVAVANLSEALSFFDMMGELGCSFALDDFGSGMSSFGYLKHLPVDYLKIDGCFVKNILSNDIDAVMVDAINSVGHAMGLSTVAEFVENGEIQDALADIGVDHFQGYGLHKPEALKDIFSRTQLKLCNDTFILDEAVA